MSPRTARALSTAIVGGIAALIFFRIGLYFWIGLTAWASLADAPAGPNGFKQTVGSLLFGAAMGWAAVVVSLLIPVPAEGWYWVARIGAMVAVAMFVLEAGCRVEMFSRRSSAILGFGAVLGATYLTFVEATGIGRYFGAHLSNPLLMVVLAFLAGTACARVSDALAGTMAKE